MSLLQRRLGWQKIAGTSRPIQERVAVLATFTANPVAPYLGMDCQDAGHLADVWIAPYDQIVQECLAAESQTSRYDPTVLLVWPRLEELWRGRPWPLSDAPDEYAGAATEIAGAALEAASRWRATLVFVLPAIPEARPLGVGDACNAAGVTATATHVRELLRRQLAQRPGVLLLDAEEVVRSLGVAASYNPSLQALARIPFSEQCFSLVGERAARLLLLARRAPRKVLVVDGDHTLWGGVVGEDGAEHIELGQTGAGSAYLDFQAYLLELRRAGVLIGFSSKNTEADAWAAFARPEMRLRREHLAAWRIGWDAKSAGLREIAGELKLGEDTLVFIDDSAAEIAEVRAATPGVACIRMPDDAAAWLGAVQDTGLLDRLPPTTEDLNRTAQYDDERRRGEQLKNTSKEAYLAQLGVKVRIFTPTAADLPRLAQLVAKTNQFNLNCRRRTATELSALCADERYFLRLAHVLDNFGDYGVVGAFIVRKNGAHAELDTFLLSCRAMGRGVEEAMVAAIFSELEQVNGGALFGMTEDYPRNEPARRFFAQLGCAGSGIAHQLARPVWPAHIESL